VPLPSDRLRDDLRRRLLAARSGRDAPATAALRASMAAVENAAAPAARALDTSTPSSIAGSIEGVGTAEVPRRSLSAADVLAVVRAERDERLEYATEYERLDQAEAAADLRAEADVLTAVLAEWAAQGV
jgi:uncharacterized protein YqeY